MRVSLDLPLNLDGRVWRHANRGHRYQPHRHDELEFNLVTRGGAHYLVGERSYDLRRHTLIWLFPAQDHVLLKPTRDFEMWIVVLRPALVRRTCRTGATRPLTRRDPGAVFCKPLPAAAAAELSAFLYNLAAAPDGDRYNAGLAYAFLLAWSLYGAAEKPAHSTGVHPAVERAARLLRDDPALVTMGELAQRSGLSPSRLSRLFKRQTGVALSAYRNRQRVDRFLDLAAQTPRQSITRAALAAGFGSYPQFHRVFKQVVGYTPAAHRRRQTMKSA